MPRLIGKTNTIKKKDGIFKNGEDQFGDEQLYALTFGPNHYGLPVTKDVYEKAIVGGHYEFDIVQESV